ncbi:MAG: CHRD domain-containing protein [Flavitalea sp.]
MNVKAFLVMAALSATCMVACKKDDDDMKNDDVVAKTGLSIAGSQEVPAKTSSASGTLDVSYNKVSKMLTFTVNYKDLTGAATGAHIHGVAARGSNAGVKYDFHHLFPTTVSGTFTNTVAVDGTSLKEDSLLSGYYYVNIHTATNPGGEIRGQIEFK